MNSLLGQFYNKIRGSQEDIASEGLVYILKQSLESRMVINQIVKTNTNLNFSDLSFQTQNVGKELERPDISGKDDTGKEVLLIEAKFWASLTNNQPNGYLKRLKENLSNNFRGPFDFKMIDELGIDGDFIESQAFAYLAIRSYLNLPISYPHTTGCKIKSGCTGGVLVKNF